MYRPSVFAEDRPAVLRALIRGHPLGTLVTHGASGVTASLLPFLLVEGETDVLRAHLARGNEQVADLRDGGEALVIFHGPQAYVSSGWYATKREHGMVVPTWNYVVVEARGRPGFVTDDAWLQDQLAVLTTAQESGAAQPWSVDDAPAGFIARQRLGIVGLEIPIDRLLGKWKVSQNQSAANRAGVAAGLRARDAAQPSADAMAALVDGPPD